MELQCTQWFELLRCPKTRGKLHWVPKGTSGWNFAEFEGNTSHQKCDGALVCEDGLGMYPVREGLPILLIEERVDLTEEKKLLLLKLQ